MNLEYQLFHGIKVYGNVSKDEKIILFEKKLENIFKVGKILSRDNINSICDTNNNFCEVNYNDTYLISLAKHPSQETEEDSDIWYTDVEEESAWEQYVLREVCLVFSSELLEETPLERSNVKIPLEVFVRNEVDLKYLVGISIPHLSLKDFKTQEEYEEYLKSHLLILKIIFRLLAKYNLNVPVFDIVTGIEYQSELFIEKPSKKK